jgi:hypothetical protein
MNENCTVRNNEYQGIRAGIPTIFKFALTEVAGGMPLQLNNNKILYAVCYNTLIRKRMI